MAIKDCIDEIRKIVGDKLSPAEVEAIAKTVANNAKRKKAQNSLLSEREALDQAAEDFANDQTLAAKIERRNRAINLATRQARQESYKAFADAGFTPYEQMSAELVGSNKRAPGAKASVAANQHGLTSRYLGGFIGDLQRAGVLEFLTRRKGLFGDGEGVIDGDVADALYNIGKDGKVAPGGDPHVKAIAETIYKWQETARLRLNRAGTWIKQLPGYIVRQSHNADTMMREGFRSWADFIRPLLKPETFGDSDPEEFLQSAYTAITSGVHLTPKESLEPSSGFKGYANLAERYSQERVFQFKDGRSWNEYNNKFGTRNLMEAVTGGLDRAAHDTALMETFGTNPEMAFRDDLAKLARDNRTDVSAMQELRGRKGHFLESLDNQWAEITGQTRYAQNLRAAQIMAAIRNGNSITKLGLALFSHLTLPVTAASELRWQGASLGSRYASHLGEFFSGMGDKEKLETAFDLGVAYEGWTNGIAARFSAPDAQPGVMSSLTRLSMKANGMSWMIGNSQAGFARAMSSRVALEGKNGWGNVNPKLRSALERYGFDENKWEVARKASQKLGDGRKYLTPDMIENLPDSAFAGMGGKTARQAQRARDQVATALQTFYRDRIDTAVPSPGARERAILNQGSQRGTLLGEVARAMGQFKQYPLSIMTRVVGRELDGQGMRGLVKGQGDVVGLASLVAQMWVAGALAMECKAIVANKTPRDPMQNPIDFSQAAFAQSGGLGLYSDFLFHEYDRFGQSPLTGLAGPTISTASDGASLLTGLYQTRTDKMGNIEPKTTMGDAIRFGASNAPFVNNFYTRTAFDYLILWHLQEWASPGYLRRSEQNLKRNTGQSYIVPPSSVVKYGGGYQ